MKPMVNLGVSAAAAVTARTIAVLAASSRGGGFRQEPGSGRGQLGAPPVAAVMVRMIGSVKVPAAVEERHIRDQSPA
ncbi:hypothetical protein [Streptomyces antimycoticus]|uniref:hypothetical protein n=1 Tax=Streptomyces antimycoticus TaxID=68175 RepID=UPI0036844A89